MKNFAIALTTVTAAFGILAGTANASDYEHISEEAGRVKNDAHRISHQLRSHFSNATHYRHLSGDLYEIRRLATHIHDSAHQGRSMRHIRNDVAKLDQKLHHFKGMLRRMQADLRHRDIHFDNSHGHVSVGFGSHFGPTRHDVRHLNSMVNRLSSRLHHLQNDVNRVVPPRIYHDEH